MVASAILFLLATAEIVVPPCGRILLNSTDYLTSVYSYLPWNETTSILEQVGYNQSVTSIISGKAGCSAHLGNDTFTYSTETCIDQIKEIGAHGVCMESMFHIDNAHQMAKLGKNDTLLAEVVKGTVELAKKAGISGFSFDWEKSGENPHSYEGFHRLGHALSIALNPIGVRTSTYSNPWFHDILNIKTLATHFNKVNVDMYKSSDFKERVRQSLKSANATSISPALSTHTDKGSENCSPEAIDKKFTFLGNKSFTEVTIFSMTTNSTTTGKKGCFTHYQNSLSKWRNGEYKPQN